MVDTIIKAPAPGMKDNVPAGKFRGGFGMETKVRNFVEGNRICEPPKRGEVCPAWGLWDGNAGHVGEYRMRKPGEDDHTLVETARNFVPPDTEVLVRTGGGWGNALDRDVDLAARDLAEGVVSLQGANNWFSIRTRLLSTRPQRKNAELSCWRVFRPRPSRLMANPQTVLF